MTNVAAAQSPTLALNANWTDAPVTLTNSGNLSAFQNTSTTAAWGWQYGDYWYPYYRPFPPEFWSRQTRPIRLTMAEVERLRVAAKKDKALKETLEKFTDHIEVIVDFGKKE